MTDGRTGMEAQALDLRIQAMWCELTRLGGARRVEVYLTRDGILKIAGRQIIPRTSEMVGTFTSAVELGHFREAVFQVFSDMVRSA